MQTFDDQRSAEHDLVRRISAGDVPDSVIVQPPTETPAGVSPTEPVRVNFGPAPVLPSEHQPVLLHLRDLSLELHAMDVAIGEHQIGLLLPMSLRVQQMKIKTKLHLEIDGARHSVMYLGGNLIYKLGNCELRCLSFIRLTE